MADDAPPLPRRRRAARLLVLSPLLVLVAGTVGSVRVNDWQRDQVARRVEERFATDTDAMLADLEALAGRYEALNPSIAETAVPAPGARATQEEFRVFADSLVLGSRFPAAFGVAWADRVPKARLGPYLTDPSIPVAALDDLAPDESRETAAVVRFAEPDSTMSIARGVDAEEFPPIAAALDLASRTGEVVLSEPFGLPLREGPERDDPPVLSFLVRAVGQGDETEGWSAVALDMEPFVVEGGGVLGTRYAISLRDTNATPMGGQVITNEVRAEPSGRSRSGTVRLYGRTLAYEITEAQGAGYGDPELTDAPLWFGLAATGGVFVLVWLLTFAEVRAQRRVDEATAELAARATRDDLTGLANRAKLRELLAEALARPVDSGGRRPALLFLDLDRFKLINDSLGHAAGDEMLCVVARRVTETAKGHLVARLGGDEFVVLVTDVHEDLDALAERILDAVAEPIRIDGREFFLQTSIGVAVADASVDAEGLLQWADAAMYDAKRFDARRIAFYTPVLLADAEERLTLVNDLRSALDLEQFAAEYQPVVRIRDGVVVGIESLARWDHPDRGRLLPGEFLDVALDTGMIAEIDRQVRAEAAREAASWPTSSEGAPPWVGMNVSAKELDAGFAAALLVGLRAAGLDPARVVLELTEADLAADAQLASQLLERLRRVGVRVAVDDFGTGQWGLTHLRRMPADLLKLDRSLVVAAAERAEDRAVLRAIIDLAHALGLEVIAEGVERAEHLRVLADAGCDHAQGWFYGRERTAAELAELWHRPGVPLPLGE